MGVLSKGQVGWRGEVLGGGGIPTPTLQLRDLPEPQFPRVVETRPRCPEQPEAETQVHPGQGQPSMEG